MDLEDLHWSQLTNRGLGRVKKAFATYRDSTRPRPTSNAPRRLSDLPPEVQTRLFGDPTAKGVMWFCLASCAGVFLAWNWSLGALPQQVDSKGRRQPPTARQLSLYRKLTDNFMIKREDIQENRWWNLVTPAFSHIGPSHWLGNSIAFYTFSSMAIRGGLTAVPYGLLVFGSAVAGHLGFLYQDAQRQQDLLQVRNGAIVPTQQTRALGLSGVVMGLGAVVSLAMPRAKVLIMGIVPCPVWLLMIGYVFYDSARLDDRTSKTGHAAHLGGAAFGAAYYLLRLRRGRW